MINIAGYWCENHVVYILFSDLVYLAQGNNGSTETVSPYDEAMDALSSLITKRSRADNNNSGDRFEFMFDYLKVILLKDVLYL